MAKSVEVAAIRIDGGTQCRAKIDTSAVSDYAEIYQDDPERLPPLEVTFDGSAYWLTDGFHRWHALNKAGLGKVKCNVVSGTQRDAILRSVGANSDHGLKRTNADKRNAVAKLLEDSEWKRRSDRWIADHCKVSHPLVAEMRKETEPEKYDPPAESEPEETLKVEELPPDESSDTENDTHREGMDGKEYAVSPSIVRDSLEREVPKSLLPAHQLAANIQAVGRKIDGIKREVCELCDKAGGEFLSVAEIEDALKVIKGKITQSRYWTECPRCGADSKAKCDRCDGRRYLPFARKGQLSAEDREFLGI